MLHSELDVEQPQEVMNFGQRADRALAATAARALFDRDRRRDAVDRIHVGSRRRLHELSGISIQRFEIPALTLGEDDIECQGRFAGTRNAGNHGHAVARNRHVHVAQVVFACPVHDDRVPPTVRNAQRHRLDRGRKRCATVRQHALPLLLVLDERTTGMRGRASHDVLRCASGQQLPAGIAAFRTEVEYPVGRANHVEVVLDHDQ